jgi:hypothetical protein
MLPVVWGIFREGLEIKCFDVTGQVSATSDSAATTPVIVIIDTLHSLSPIHTAPSTIGRLLKQPIIYMHGLLKH